MLCYLRANLRVALNVRGMGSVTARVNDSSSALRLDPTVQPNAMQWPLTLGDDVECDVLTYVYLTTADVIVTPIYNTMHSCIRIYDIYFIIFMVSE